MKSSDDDVAVLLRRYVTHRDLTLLRVLPDSALLECLNVEPVQEGDSAELSGVCERLAEDMRAEAAARGLV